MATKVLIEMDTAQVERFRKQCDYASSGDIYYDADTYGEQETADSIQSLCDDMGELAGIFKAASESTTAVVIDLATEEDFGIEAKGYRLGASFNADYTEHQNSGTLFAFLVGFGGAIGFDKLQGLLEIAKHAPRDKS